MKKASKHLCSILSLITCGAITASADTYSGNGNNGFAGGTNPGPLGASMLTVTNDASGNINFSLQTPGGFGNDIAFYFSTGAAGINSTLSLADNGDAGRRSITGDSTTAGVGPSVVNFAAGFAPTFAAAIDGAGNGNLFSIPNANSAVHYLGYVSTINYSITKSPIYTFTLSATALGLKVANGTALSFVATLGNGSDGTNQNDYYRSNEAIGASDADGTGASNLGNEGALTFTGFDTYTLAGIVPEPSTYVMMTLGVLALGAGQVIRRRRSGMA